MALWLNRSGKHCEHETKFLNEGRVYLTWEGLEKDLGQLASRDELLTLLEEIYPNSKKNRRIQNSSQIWAFANRMSTGDWVCMPSKQKTIHIGEITSDYTHNPNAQDPYHHYRTVNWLETDIPRTNFDQDLLHSLGAFSTICQIKRNDAEARIRAMKTNSWKSIGVKANPTKEPTDEESADEFDLEQIARDQIARTIYAQYKGHGLESLVEAILQAQGFTTHHSNKGADGGIDILAAPGTLGFGTPRICVQVKSQASALERPVLDQLVGTMRTSEPTKACSSAGAASRKPSSPNCLASSSRSDCGIKKNLQTISESGATLRFVSVAIGHSCCSRWHPDRTVCRWTT